MAKYNPFHIHDIGLGLNKFHTLDKIPDGMMSSIKNMDPKSNGQLVTRAGYEQYYGCIPLRANSIINSGTTYTLTFDTAISINLGSSVSGPIVVSGDLPSADGPYVGDFSAAFSSHWYTGFTLPQRETFAAGSPATSTKTAAQTGISQDKMMVAWFESTSANDLSNTLFVPQDVQITQSNYEINMDYLSADPITGFFGFLETPAKLGVVHIETYTSKTDWSVSAATHDLNNDNFIIRCYKDAGGVYTEVTPQSITVDADSNIAITMGSNTAGIAIIYATDDLFTGAATTPGLNTIAVTGVTEPFNLYDIWLLTGNTKTNVTVQSVTWDSATETSTISFFDPTGAEALEVNWLATDYVSNQLQFEGTDSGTTYTSLSPEITVWGLCHSGIYTNAAPKGGFTHHIDNYKSETAEKMVTALGGNLLQATSYSAGSSTYKMPSLTLRRSNRVSGAQILAPLFNAATTSRTRGDFYDASVDGAGYAKVSTVAYSGTTGQVDYTFEFTALSDDPLSGLDASTGIGTNDYLTTINCGRDVNNGTFKVVSITYVNDTKVTIRVENTSVVDTRFDESSISASGNVFTDRVLMTGTPVFIVGDKMSSINTSDNVVKSIDVSSANHVFIQDVTSTFTVSDGILVFAKRTSTTVALQSFPNESVGDDTEGGLVTGDSLFITGVDNTTKIKYINSNATGAASISISTGVATLTLAGHGLNVGQTVVIYATSDSDFEGEYTIVSTPTTGTFTVSTTADDTLTFVDSDITAGSDIVTLVGHSYTAGQVVRIATSGDETPSGLSLATDYYITTVSGNDFGFATTYANAIAGTAIDIGLSSTQDDTFTIAVSATLEGMNVELDESIELVPGPTVITLRPEGRWTVVEMPKSTAARVLETKVQHFDESGYTTQPYTKSVIVNDSMFLINDTDEVKKFDGSNLMNAGLPPFQGWFFANVDTTVTSMAAKNSVPFDNGASSPYANKFFLTDSNAFKVGERFRVNTSGNIYTITSTASLDVSGDTKYKIFVYETIANVNTENQATGTMTPAITYRYYVRYNALDINRNIIASASLGADDMYVETFTKSQINLKCLGLPPFAELDHDRIEIEIYRTKGDSPNEFFRIHRRLLDYGDLGGYISHTDFFIDDQLTFSTKDEPIYDLLDLELGNQWTNAPIASAITTANNSLVLANIKSPPTMDINFESTTDSLLAASDFTGTLGQVQFQRSTATSGSETFNDSIVFSFHVVGNAFELTPTTDIGFGQASLTNAFSDSDVTVADVIGTTAHGLATGIKVVYTQADVSTLGDLDDGTTYYVIRLGDNTYSLATTLARAYAGTAVSIPTGGSGSGRAITVISTPHVSVVDTTLGNRAAGDWVYFFHLGKGENNTLDMAGWYRLSEVATGGAIIEMNHNRSGGLATSSDVNRFLVSTATTLNAGERVPVLLSADGNMNQIYANSLLGIRTIVSSRLAMAINAVMSSDSPTNAYWVANGLRPTPWLLAQGGQSFNTGELRVQLVDSPTGTVNFQWSGFTSAVTTYLNGDKILTGVATGSQIRQFNSRIVKSYPGFPEIFDNPFGDVGKSYSAIDVNPADGQEIVSLMPFFGKSTFGAANLTEVVIAFKTNSIYAVNIVSGATQKLQSNGKGCTAPRSVALTRDGIMFANESGIYRLGWDMNITWVGRMLNDLWKDGLDLGDIAEFAGHNYNQGQKYKLSVVTSSSNFPDNVLVYDHTREEVGQPGSWTEYTNHTATGWSNQTKDAFFGSQDGRIFKVRNLGDMTDFRDDASAVAEQSFVTGGIHYGLPGNRKTTAGITIQFQNDATLTDINVSTEQSLSGTFNASTQIDLSSDNTLVRYSLVERKGTAVRLKMTKSGTKDEQLQLSRLSFHVKDTGDTGTPQAAKTT